MKSVVSITFFLCFSFSVHPQTTQRIVKPSLDHYLTTIKHYRYFKPDSAWYFINQGLLWAASSEDSIMRAAILLQQGMMLDNEGDFDKSYMVYTEALATYNNLHLEKEIASATIRIGVVELRKGNYDKAIEYFLGALKISEKLGDAYGKMEAYYSISWAYLDQEKDKEAMSYLIQADEQNKNIPFSSTSLNILNHFGVLYTRSNEYEKAASFLQQGVASSNQPEYQGLYITLLNNLAIVYARQGNPNKAIRIQKGALQKSREMKNYLRELQALFGLARTYRDVDITQSIFYAQQAIHLARSNKAYRQEMRYLKFVTKLYKESGDFKEALTTKEREHTLADSFYYHSMNQEINELKAEYELAKSNARIEELDHQNIERTLELEKSNLVRNVMLIGTTLLLIIVVLMFSQYRLKQKASDRIAEKNKVLHRLVNEKEWLLKEVHHRVKNNLQTVVSLLETQSVYLRGQALLAIQESQNRVYTMSLIHQKLYLAKNVSSVSMDNYLPDLVSYLRECFNVKSGITFRLHIEPIELDVSQAVPIGLILNEAITNTIKYAFPERQSNVVTIDMVREEDNGILLCIADNGIGLPPDFRIEHSLGLGLNLMKGLIGDIGGEFMVSSDEGTLITIRFRADVLLHELDHSGAEDYQSA